MNKSYSQNVIVHESVVKKFN